MDEKASTHALFTPFTMADAHAHGPIPGEQTEDLEDYIPLNSNFDSRDTHFSTHTAPCRRLLYTRLLALLLSEVTMAIYFFASPAELNMTCGAGEILRIYNAFNLLRRWLDTRLCHLPARSVEEEDPRPWCRRIGAARCVFLCLELALAWFMVPDLMSILTPSLAFRVGDVLKIGLVTACLAA